MISAPIRPVQKVFKTPECGKQESRYPAFHLPNTQLDNKPRTALNAVRLPVDAVVKGGSPADDRLSLMSQYCEKCLSSQDEGDVSMPTVPGTNFVFS